MKKMMKFLPYLFLALFLVVGSTQAYAAKKVSIQTCKACRGIANELEDALYQRDNLREILRNWESRYNRLSKQLGSVKALKAKLAAASGTSAVKDAQARLDAVQTAQDKVKILRGKVREAVANANSWQARFNACHKKHCKGQRQGGRAIGMGGYVPHNLRRASTTCKPCQKYVDKLNKKYRQIYNAERRLNREQIKLERLLSRYGTAGDLNHNIKKLWSKYSAAKGADKQRYHKKWKEKTDQAGELADAQEDVALSKSLLKQYEAEAKELNAKLADCVRRRCKDKPGFGYIPGYEGTGGGKEHAYAGLGTGFIVTHSTADVNVPEEEGSGRVRDEVTGAGSASQRNNGASFLFFMGLQMPINDRFFANVEATFIINTICAKAMAIAGIPYGHVGIQNSVWLTINPGVNLSSSTELYARVGASAGRLSVNVNGADNFHKSLPGLVTGAGIQTEFDNGYAVRVEYDHVNYQAYEGSLTGGNRREVFNPTSDQVMVSAVKKFAV